MAAHVEIFGGSIVVLGAFNPVIFSPDWLERCKLIGKDDADAVRRSDKVIIARPVSRLETEWFVLQVTEENFSLSSNGPLSPAVRDLAMGALSLLPQTPAKAVGLNFYAHYKMETVEDYHKVGDVYAPKDIWMKLFSGEKRSTGLIDLQIGVFPHSRTDTPTSNERKQITIQPSAKVKYGVYFAYNDHHPIVNDPNGPQTSMENVVKIIEEQWQAAWDDAKRVFDGLIDHALKA